MNTPTSGAAALPEAGCSKHHLIHCSQCRHDNMVRDLRTENDRLTTQLAALAAGQAVAPAEPEWWRKRADEIELQVALTGSRDAMRCYTDMRTLLQSATRPAPPAMDGGDAEDAKRWRMLPAFFEEYQIDAMKLYRDIDAARAAKKEGEKP